MEISSIDCEPLVTVSAIEGEPAIVVNGFAPGLFSPAPGLFSPVRDELVVSAKAFPCKQKTVSEERGHALKGRRLRKKFGKKIYTGEVAAFDPTTNWYLIKYEDGDKEELDWQEIKHLLLPREDAATMEKRRILEALAKISKKNKRFLERT